MFQPSDLRAILAISAALFKLAHYRQFASGPLAEVERARTVNSHPGTFALVEKRLRPRARQADTTNGRATGVTLADGTRYETGIVASNVSAKLTFLKFLDKSKLPVEFVRDLEASRTFSTAFKINIACEALPKYTAFDPAACGFAYDVSDGSAHLSPDAC
jgi:hypothetical protein